MTDILPPAGWPNVRQLETNEFATGGANGNMNEQAKSLAARSELLKQYATLPYESKTGGYALNERVQLATGDIVRSTIPSNVNNPNVDMTGWERKDSIIVKSISKLKLIRPSNQATAYATSYKEGLTIGGGHFVCIKSNVLTENLTSVFRSSLVGYEEYFWVRINFDALTPAMCGAVSGQNCADAIERFFNTCGTGVKGSGEIGRTYLIERPLVCYFNSSTQIDMCKSTLKPSFTVPSGEVMATVEYKTKDSEYLDDVVIEISNIAFDCSLVPLSIPTNGTNRRGISGLVVRSAGEIIINGYKCKDSFYGCGLMLKDYNTATLNRVYMSRVGVKLNPDTDDTSPYDAAGDAIYLGDIRGHGNTSISNSNCSSYSEYYGRAGLVLEQFTGLTLSHKVVLTNVSFDGYHRILHQEDHGVGTVIWIGGNVSNFSNLAYNLGGRKDTIHYDLSGLTIEVNPRYSYGGTSGINNFQGFGECVLSKCTISYLKGVAERGNKTIQDSILNIYGVVDHGVSTKPHVLKGNTINVYGGYMYYAATNKGCSSSNNTFNNLKDSVMVNAMHSVNSAIHSTGDTFNNVSISAENTLPIGLAKNTITGGQINYTGETNSYMFSGSYQTAFKLTNVSVNALNATLVFYGDGGTRHSVIDCELRNIVISQINGGATSMNGITKLRNNDFYLDDKFTAPSPLISEFGVLHGILSNNTIFDATTAQNINYPAASATVILNSNNIIKGGVVS